MLSVLACQYVYHPYTVADGPNPKFMSPFTVRLQLVIAHEKRKSYLRYVGKPNSSIAPLAKRVNVPCSI